MILSHDEIITERENGNIIIEPFTLDQVGANSYDVNLSSVIKRVYYNSFFGIDYKKPQKTKCFTIPEKGKWIFPWQLWLGSTIEKAGSDKYVPMYEGRSTLGRMGLFSHISAGFGDIGFKRTWTLEFSCVLPFKLYPRMKIGQVYFVQASSNNWLYDRDHKGHYADQDGVTEAKT
jgi:dCTP deaminase